MASRLSSVVDVRVIRPGESVYGLFKDCGTIESIHSWKKADEPDGVGHYFVVFADTTSVSRAVTAPAATAAGATVTPLDAHEDLAAEYMQLCSDTMDMDPPPKASTSNAGATLEMRPPPVPSVRTAQPTTNGTEAVGGSREPSMFLRGVLEQERAARPQRTWTTNKSSSSTTDNTRPPLVPGVVDTLSTGFPTSLDLQHMGASIRLDLTSLDAEQPRALISLLAKTGADRATWMLAGAHLRRTGHPASALAVVSAMVEAMKKAGTPENDLKPAFLFLSGCHTDLARRASATAPAPEAGSSTLTSTTSTSSIDHAAESKRLLRKAYGPQRPEAPERSRQPPPPAITTRAQENPNPNSNPKGGNKRGRQGAAGGDPGQIQILQREVQSLRDRNEHLTRQLRKAERASDDVQGELSNERAARRRAESAADAARREVQAVRRDLRVAEVARDDALRRLEDFEQTTARMVPLPPGMMPMPMPVPAPPGLHDPAMYMGPMGMLSSTG